MPLFLSAPSLAEAADGLAITMVLLLAFSLGIILSMLIIMARNAGKKSDIPDEHSVQDTHVDRGFQDKKIRIKSSKPSWERADDWWKEDSSH